MGYLYKMGADEILWRYVPEFECDSILVKAHGGAPGGHYAGKSTTQKILCTGLWWPKLHKDSKHIVRRTMPINKLVDHRRGMNYCYTLRYLCKHFRSGRSILLGQFSHLGRKRACATLSLPQNV